MMSVPDELLETAEEVSLPGDPGNDIEIPEGIITSLVFTRFDDSIDYFLDLAAPTARWWSDDQGEMAAVTNVTFSLNQTLALPEPEGIAGRIELTLLHWYESKTPVSFTSGPGKIALLLDADGLCVFCHRSPSGDGE